MCISSSGHMASLFRFISLIASVVTFIPNFECKLKSLTWVIGGYINLISVYNYIRE